MDAPEMDQSNLLKNKVEFDFIVEFRPRTIEPKDKKRDTYESAYVLYEGRKLVLYAFIS